MSDALARNPVPIIILCHRVVRTDNAIALGSGGKRTSSDRQNVL
ncbi:MAG TPA: MGMT family protein [Candidatus Binatia bacterium]